MPRHRGSPLSAPNLLLLLLASFPLITPASTIQAAPPKQLTTDGRLKRDPVYVRDGNEIVYSVSHRSPRLVLSRLNLKDGTISRLHPEAATPEFKATFSTNEQRYTFLAMTGNDNLSLMVRDVTLKQTKKISLSKAVVWHASITPDGSRVVFSLNAQIISRPIGSGTETVLAKSAGRNSYPAVSPNGKQIAFGSSRDGNFEIYRMNIDGTGVTRLTTHPGLDTHPAWSPDGRQIAYTSVRNGNYEIYVMNADGTNPRNVTNHDERDDYAAWHPNGQHLVHVAERNGRFDLYQTNVGESAYQLKPSGGR